MGDAEPDQATVWLSDASVADNGTMTLPASARRHLGLEGPATVLVFAQPGRVVVTSLGLAEELLEFAATRTAARVAAQEAEGR